MCILAAATRARLLTHAELNMVLPSPSISSILKDELENVEIVYSTQPNARVRLLSAPANNTQRLPPVTDPRAGEDAAIQINFDDSEVSLLSVEVNSGKERSP